MPVLDPYFELCLGLFEARICLFTRYRLLRSCFVYHNAQSERIEVLHLRHLITVAHVVFFSHAGRQAICCYCMLAFAQTANMVKRAVLWRHVQILYRLAIIISSPVCIIPKRNSCARLERDGISIVQCRYGRAKRVLRISSAFRCISRHKRCTACKQWTLCCYLIGVHINTNCIHYTVL